MGAAALGESGSVHTGCNIENASYGATLCAERVAIGGLVASGERKLFVIAVYVEAPRLAMPCGICRQTIVEFGPAATVIVANQDQSMVVPIEELLPKPFVFDPTD